MKLKASGLAGLTLFLFLVSATPLRAENLPAASDVLGKYINATGGMDAWEKVETVSLKGEFKLAAMGITGPIAMYTKLPGEHVTRIEIPGAGVQMEGIIDGVAWENSLMTGARIKDGKERETALRQADTAWMTRPEEHYKSMECVAIEEINGHPCYKLVMTPITGEPETHFYDVETGLPHRIEMTVHHQMGDIAASMSVSEFRETSGIKVPTAMVLNAAGMEQVLSFSEVEINGELPDAIFKLPAEVEALLETVEESK